MEERSQLRRTTSETTNSLSVFDRVRSIQEIFSAVAVGFSGHSGSRASLSLFVRRGVPRARSLTPDRRPSRITRKSYRQKSQIEPWFPLKPPFCFAGFRTDRLRCKQAMKTAGQKTQNRCAAKLSNRAHGADGQKHILLNQRGCEARKTPAVGVCFS